MDERHPTEGRHILLDVWGVGFDVLNDVDRIRSTMLGAAEVAGATVAALVLAACMVAVLWKRTGRSHRDRPEDQSGGFVDLGRLEVGPTAEESLLALEQRARSEGKSG